jgi:hypothetical protein
MLNETLFCFHGSSDIFKMICLFKLKYSIEIESTGAQSKKKDREYSRITKNLKDFELAQKFEHTIVTLMPS